MSSPDPIRPGQITPGLPTHDLAAREQSVRLLTWRRVARDGLILCLTVLAVRLLIVDIYRVDSASMRPSFEIGDLLVVLRPAYGPNIAAIDIDANRRLRDALGSGLPSRGDAVLYRRHADGTAFLKRVVAVGGDEIAFDNGVPAIDGVPLPQTFVGIHDRGGRLLLEQGQDGGAYTVLDTVDAGDSDRFPPTAVPAGQVFMAGDNRDSSVDSRQSGPVPGENVLGRVIWRIGR